MKSLLPYYGGKGGAIGQQIVNRLPIHKVYVEAFGGMAGVLLKKKPVHQEVYNDIHSSIVNLMRVVRDPAQHQQLLQLLELTPYAREEWRYCRDNYRTELNPIEQARMTYVCLAQGFVGSLGNKSWSFGGLKYTSSTARNFYNGLPDIIDISLRLRNVTIENTSWEALLDRWDSKQTLFYLDPPYVPSTRKTNTDYVYEMSYEDHQRLVSRCIELDGMAMVSGYPNQLYTSVLEDAGGWVREDLPAQCQVAKAQGSDHQRTESIWFSPSCKHKPRKRYLQQALSL